MIAAGAKSGTTWMLYCAHQVRIKGSDSEELSFIDVNLNTPWPERQVVWVDAHVAWIDGRVPWVDARVTWEGAHMTLVDARLTWVDARVPQRAPAFFWVDTLVSGWMWRSSGGRPSSLGPRSLRGRRRSSGGRLRSFGARPRVTGGHACGTGGHSCSLGGAPWRSPVACWKRAREASANSVLASSSSKSSSEASCGPLGARPGGFCKFYPGKLVLQELLGGILCPLGARSGGFCKCYPGPRPPRRPPVARWELAREASTNSIQASSCPKSSLGASCGRAWEASANSIQASSSSKSSLA